MNQPQTDLKPWATSYYSAADARIQPKMAILEDRFLHKIFLLTHVPATWPAWKLAFGLLLATGLVWVLWWLAFGSLALVPAFIYLGFALIDWLLIWWLPRQNQSFGPIGPQLLVNTVPRMGVAFVAVVMAWISGSFGFGLWIIASLQLFGTLVYMWGMIHEPFALTTTPRSIQTAGWSDQAPPLRLLHLSDLHVERLTRRENHLLKLIDQAQPDIIVITGDYLNLSYVNEPVARAEVRKLLAKIKAPYGVYATLGSPPVDPRDTTPSLFDDLDIRLLCDEVAVVQLPHNRKLSLLGLNCEHDLASDASAFHRLLELAPTDSMRILLYHSPELMPLVQQQPVNLYLCGHTHGGQIRLPWYGAVLTSSVTGKRYEMGPYLEQNTLLYVSRGIGLEGLSAPRMRLLCPPEIILFSLSGNGKH